MERILITGGLGFVGHHLVQKLLKDYSSFHVTIVDNQTGSEIPYDEFLQFSNVEVHKVNLLDYLPNCKFDQIYHLASPVGSLAILNREKGIAQEILELVSKVTDIAASTNAKLMYVSSSEIYGWSDDFSEKKPITIGKVDGARTEYALGKLTGEVYLRNEGIRRKLKYNICRPFNLIGTKQSKVMGFVVPIFFEKAIKGEPLPVFCDGNQLRTFCYITDFIEGLIKFQNSSLLHVVLNLGNNENKISILNLAKKIIQICNSRSVIEFLDPKEKFGPLYVEGGEKIADIRYAEELLSWKPKISLHKSLIQIFQEEYKIAT